MINLSIQNSFGKNRFGPADCGRCQGLSTCQTPCASRPWLKQLATPPLLRFCEPAARIECKPMQVFPWYSPPGFLETYNANILRYCSISVCQNTNGHRQIHVHMYLSQRSLRSNYPRCLMGEFSVFLFYIRRVGAEANPHLKSK